MFFCLGQNDTARVVLEELRNGQSHLRSNTDMGNVYFGLARVMESQGNLVAARSDYEQSIKVYTEILGDVHPVLTQVYALYGHVLVKSGKLDEARTAFQNALKVEEFSFGSDSKRALLLRNQLASLRK